MEPGNGPTVGRIRLGSQLRRLREASGVSREEAGYLIRASESKISRMELGRVGFKVRDIEDLLVRYGVEDKAEREALVTLARQANAPAWWQQYGDLLPPWFQTFLGLEEAASVLRVYEVQFVPGLLQTVDYTRAIVARARPRASESEIERRGQMRQARQQMFGRPDGPHLWAVVDEAVLRRPVGGTQVFRAQIEHLIAMAEEPKITLQVVPFRLGAHSAESGAFTIMRFPAPDLPDVVYVEQLTGALYLEKVEDVDSYSEAMELLSIASEPPGRTPDILRAVLADLE